MRGIPRSWNPNIVTAALIPFKFASSVPIKRQASSQGTFECFSLLPFFPFPPSLLLLSLLLVKFSHFFCRLYSLNLSSYMRAAESGNSRIIQLGRIGVKGAPTPGSTDPPLAPIRFFLVLVVRKRQLNSPRPLPEQVVSKNRKPPLVLSDFLSASFRLDSTDTTGSFFFSSTHIPYIRVQRQGIRILVISRFLLQQGT